MKNSLLVLFICSSCIINAQFLSKKENLKKEEGFFTYYYNQDEDELYLEVDKLGEEFIYVHSLKSGVGSNDLGLDRGQLGGTSIVKFERAGNKLLLIEPNQDYRAITDNVAERTSIEQAFAKSVLYGFEIKEETEDAYIIDLTPFLLEDAHQISRKLKRAKEGTYKVDKSKSALALKNTKAFPKNTEFEALLTLKGEPSGKHLRTVVPNASLITVVQHHSFVQLPDEGYTPRAFDPRSGAIFKSYLDYATPIQEPIRKRVIIRHRLEKKNPTAAVSEAKKPIIYYLDPGTPEPVRTALLEGARWWNQAYEDIGYKNAFQVKMLPEDADPMDLRYNVIQWVHRSTRGWSYGASVTDPRTGEILKGHVSLGSLRIRQDYLIAQALMNEPFGKSDTNYTPMLEMALARIRQLSAHEVGHTLGFAHNFAASTKNRASVMDYPHPTLSLEGQNINFKNAYDTGIGAWDKVTVAYSYGDVPNDMTEKQYLNTVLEQAEAQGLRFISDSDARASSGAHPDAHLWDNGKNATQELNDVLALRTQAIENFSEDNFRTGEPYSVLEDVFVPLYFYHRYQTEATIKVIGGLHYNYAVKGDTNQEIQAFIDADSQEDALEAVLATLSAKHLAIPKATLTLFPPRAFGYNRTRESFKGNTGVTFDPLGAVETASAMTLRLLLNPERLNRIVSQHAINTSQPTLDDILEKTVSHIFAERQKNDYYNQVQNVVRFETIKHLKNVYVSKKSTPIVKAIAYKYLLEIVNLTKEHMPEYATYIAQDITQFIERPEEFKAIPEPKIPDGSPIGSYNCIID